MKTNSTNLLIISIVAITAGCTGTVPENSHEDDFADLTGKITLKSDEAFIKSDGTDAATFRVMLSADDGTGNYALANCTVCQLEETVAYEYVR